jgi:hypothetical protein
MSAASSPNNGCKREFTRGIFIRSSNDSRIISTFLFWQSLGTYLGDPEDEREILDEGDVIPVLPEWESRWLTSLCILRRVETRPTHRGRFLVEV